MPAGGSRSRATARSQAAAPSSRPDRAASAGCAQMERLVLLLRRAVACVCALTDGPSRRRRLQSALQRSVQRTSSETDGHAACKLVTRSGHRAVGRMQLANGACGVQRATWHIAHDMPRTTWPAAKRAATRCVREQYQSNTVPACCTAGVATCCSMLQRNVLCCNGCDGAPHEDRSCAVRRAARVHQQREEEARESRSDLTDGKVRLAQLALPASAAQYSMLGHRTTTSDLHGSGCLRP